MARMHLTGRPGAYCGAQIVTRDRNGRAFVVSGEGDDWADAVAMAARELLEARRAGVVRMTPQQVKRVAAVSFLDSPQIKPAIAAGASVLQQAKEQAVRAAVAQGQNAAKAAANAVEDAAGPAVKAVLSQLPLGGAAYEAGVQVWRQVKKIPLLGRLFG